MLTVETWAEIRRLHIVEKLSKRAIARRLGLHRATVTRALASQLLPVYHRAPQGLDLRGGPLGQVGQSAVLDGLPLPIALAQ